MKIAIQAADLDSPRIDGTRVYISNLLKYFGRLDSTSEFLIYHKNKFNPELVPPNFPNYKIITKSLACLWTQTLFASSLWKDKPDVLWMPMHNIPLLRKKGLKTIVTIHDLAFKYFPETFTKKDLFKINFLTKIAVNLADKIITVSESSKRDILKFYPRVKKDRIKVIYHGFDRRMFREEREMEKEQDVKNRLGIQGKYILYVGALQPRKNLEVLIEAFDKIRAEFSFARELKLVLAGEKAWLWEDVLKKINRSRHKNDIIMPGKVHSADLGHLMRGAEVFCFPSLYEGFGIPVLEALASGVPVICANNSSLPEVGGAAAIYFDGQDADDLAGRIKDMVTDGNLRESYITKGFEQIKKFSWEKCAKETLAYLKD
jgi:glycosyltransferase involved in cell wall biosynthesis